MDIILVSNRYAKTRSVKLSGVNLSIAVLFALCLLLITSFALQYAMVQLKPDALSGAYLVGQRPGGWAAPAANLSA